MPSDPLTCLQDRLGYTFADPGLLRQALTPPSAGLPADNQRLEFLGDAILQFCVSELVCQAHPEWQEGALSKLRGLFVCTTALRAWAEDLGLQLLRGPRSGKAAPLAGAGKPLADAMEALFAAVYLDAGSEGMPAVRRLIVDRWGDAIRAATPGSWEERDAKTTLQERAARLELPAPVYETLSRQGPDHAPVFEVRVRVGPIETTARAGSLKAAQTLAARAALARLS